MNLSTWLQSLVLLMLVVLVAGCGPARRPTVKTAKVSGTIKMDGQPLADAQVNFLAAEYAGVANTDATGHYELEAQPGANKVYVVKYEGVGPNFDETMIGSSDAPGASGPKQLVPKKYSEPASTELEFTVPDAGSTDANFELTSR